MGLYDTIIFDCQWCSEEIKEHTKSGECNLDEYSLFDAPVDVLGGVYDYPIKCENCGKHNVIKVKTIATAGRWEER